MIVIGATNAGKSSFLINAAKMKGFFNVDEKRETSHFWRYKLDS